MHAVDGLTKPSVPASARQPAPTALSFSMANVVAAAKGAKEQSEISAGGNGRSRFGMLWKKAALQIKIDCTNAKPKLVDEAPAWWPVPDRARVAADSFDRQYKTSVARAERVFQ